MTTQSDDAPSPFSHPSIGDGYLAALALVGLPLWAPLFGVVAASINLRYGFPVQMTTMLGLYVFGVRLALSAWRKPGFGSRLAGAFSLVVALVLPLLFRAILLA